MKRQLQKCLSIFMQAGKTVCNNDSACPILSLTAVLWYRALTWSKTQPGFLTPPNELEHLVTLAEFSCIQPTRHSS